MKFSAFDLMVMFVLIALAFCWESIMKYSGLIIVVAFLILGIVAWTKVPNTVDPIPVNTPPADTATSFDLTHWLKEHTPK